MHLRFQLILLLAGLLLSGCAAPAPTWRSQASALVERLGRNGAQDLLTQEYHNLVETFEHGEAVLHVKGDGDSADSFYLLALQKGELLRLELKELKRKQQEEQRRLESEKAARLEEERLAREAAETEERLRLQEEKRRQAQEAAAKRSVASHETVQQQPVVYTVHRGESLPQIAAKADIYNDSSLWPLIYRANRDQIRDPRQLWPGQVLKIPRRFSREELIEAKRYSSRK